MSFGKHTCGLALALSLLTPRAVLAQRGFVPPDPAYVAKAERSVALIQAMGIGKPDTATGFVIAYKGRKIIVTAAHVLQGGMNLSAQFQNHESGIRCDPIDYSDELDLMALVPRSPHEIPADIEALELDPDFQFNHQESPSVWLYARPGSQSARHVLGYINAASIDADTLQSARNRKRAPQTPASIAPDQKFVRGRPTPRGPTKVIQYVTNLDPGTSGGPLLNHAGKVIGIQSGRMLNPDGTPSSSVFYAVSANHLISSRTTANALDLSSTTDVGLKKALAALERSASPVYEFTSVAPAAIKVGNRTLDAGCFDMGIIPQDAADVIDNYMQAPESFRRDFGEDVLQQYLGRAPVSFMVNLAFGFSFLKPAGCAIKSEPFEEKLGIRLTVSPADQVAAQPYSPLLTLLIFTADEYYALNMQEWEDMARDRLNALQRQYPDRYVDPVLFQRNAVKRLMLQEIAAHFEEKSLRLIRLDADTVCYANDRTHVLKKTLVSDDSSRSTDRSGVENAWFRVNYRDDRSGEILAVHCGSAENIAIIASYRCLKDDLEAFVDRELVRRSFIDQRLIRASLSFF